MEYIYILIDPISNECRYVGKAKNPDKRFKRHLWEANRPGKKKHLYCWIKSLLNKNEEPLQIIIDETEDWEYWEAFYIEYYKFIGCNLTNLCEGGKGSSGYTHTEEWKKAQGIRAIGNTNTLGFKHSDLTKKRMSLAKLGKKKSKETIEKMSIATKKQKRDESKLSEKDIIYIRSKPKTQDKLAVEYGVTQSHISRIQNGKVWEL